MPKTLDSQEKRATPLSCCTGGHGKHWNTTRPVKEHRGGCYPLAKTAQCRIRSAHDSPFSLVNFSQVCISTSLAWRVRGAPLHSPSFQCRGRRRKLSMPSAPPIRIIAADHQADLHVHYQTVLPALVFHIIRYSCKPFCVHARSDCLIILCCTF